MDPAKKLNFEINTSRRYIQDLEMDPKLNQDILVWMRMILEKLEDQLNQWEVLGFDSGGDQHSFHAFTICKN